MAAHLANGEAGLEVHKHISICTAADECGKLTAPRLFVGGGAEVDGKDAELCGVGRQEFLQQLEEVILFRTACVLTSARLSFSVCPLMPEAAIALSA